MELKLGMKIKGDQRVSWATCCSDLILFYFFIQLANDIKMKTKQKHEICWAAGEHKKHKRALSPEGAVLPTQQNSTNNNNKRKVTCSQPKMTINDLRSICLERPYMLFGQRNHSHTWQITVHFGNQKLCRSLSPWFNLRLTYLEMLYDSEKKSQKNHWQ